MDQFGDKESSLSGLDPAAMEEPRPKLESDGSRRAWTADREPSSQPGVYAAASCTGDHQATEVEVVDLQPNFEGQLMLER